MPIKRSWSRARMEPSGNTVKHYVRADFLHVFFILNHALFLLLFATIVLMP